LPFGWFSEIASGLEGVYKFGWDTVLYLVVFAVAWLGGFVVGELVNWVLKRRRST